MLGFLSLQEPFERGGEREGPTLVVLRRVRVQADDASLEIDVPPLELQPITSFCRFRMNAFTSAVVIAASRLPPECGCKCSRNSAFELVSRSPSIHGVFGLEIVGGFVEADSIQLRIHRQAMRDVAFAELQQIDRVGFLGAVARPPDWAAVPVVLDPPDSAAFVCEAVLASVARVNKRLQTATKIFSEDRPAHVACES